MPVGESPSRTEKYLICASLRHFVLLLAIVQILNKISQNSSFDFFQSVGQVIFRYKQFEFRLKCVKNRRTGFAVVQPQKGKQQYFDNCQEKVSANSQRYVRLVCHSFYYPKLFFYKQRRNKMSIQFDAFYIGDLIYWRIKSFL